mgnify:CR=1 FL=1
MKCHGKRNRYIQGVLQRFCGQLCYNVRHAKSMRICMLRYLVLFDAIMQDLPNADFIKSAGLGNVTSLQIIEQLKKSML